MLKIQIQENDLKEHFANVCNEITNPNQCEVANHSSRAENQMENGN